MIEELVQRLEKAVVRLEAIIPQRPNIAKKPTLPNCSAQVLTDTPPSVRQYDEAIEDSLKSFLEISASIGGDVADVGKKVRILFDLQRNFIWSASGQLEPTDPSQIQSKLEPIAQQIQSISVFQQSKRNTTHFNHLSSIFEAIQALGWVTVKPAPAPFVKDMLDAAMFYLNRVRTANKDNQVHLDWAKALCKLFMALHVYVRQVHTTGFVWNSSPGTAPFEQNNLSSNGAKAEPTNIQLPPSGASGPPAPPPPPPPSIFGDAKPTANSGGDSDRQKLFEALNKGEAITAGLRKVTDNMKTYKNPELRGQNSVTATGVKLPGVSSAKKVLVNHSPKTELKDYKVWNVEYHKGNADIVVKTDKKQAVYIYKCENSVVQIKGKVNSVTVDSCKKTNVVFESLLAQIEIINSQSVKVQTLDTLPTISIQKTDGCQVYLSKNSLNAEIITSKSSEMNILTPSGQDGDFVEYPVPEQFKTIYSLTKKQLETTVSDIV